MSAKRGRLAAMLGAVLCLVLVAALAHPPWPQWPLASIDASVLGAVQQVRTPWADTFFGAVSAMAAPRAVAAATFVLVIVLIAAGRPRDALALAACIFATAFVSDRLQVIFERARPLDPESLVAFPSGHAALAAAFCLCVASLVSARWPRSARRFAFACAGVLALLVAISRIWLGDHWPSDAAAGLLLGTAAYMAVFASRGPRTARAPACLSCIHRRTT